MLTTTSYQVVDNAKFSQNFSRPCYDNYCFSNIPGTIQFLLTGNGQSTLPMDILGLLPTRYDRVVLFFIDAFGWRFFERYVERFSFLKTVLNEGMVSKMTSQFPSTTAAHATCIHTGLPVGQSGVYEWNYYEPLLDEIISPLLFSYAGDKLARETIKGSTALPSSAFFPEQTLYQSLQAQGITSHILQFRAYTPSTFSDIVFRGAQVHPYMTLREAFAYLCELLTTPIVAPSYYFLYFDRIDAACHHYGPFSRQFEESVDNCLTQLEQLFYQNVRGKSGNTLLMLTADHGQVAVDPKITYYLNRQMPGVTRFLKTNKRGAPLVPAGSPRDMFLHVQEEYIDTVIGELRQRLAGRAEVYRTQELLERNFFGPPAPVFLARVGNVVILPYRNETVWWYEEGRFDMHFLGHHGGLTPEEMEIPLLVLPL